MLKTMLQFRHLEDIQDTPVQQVQMEHSLFLVLTVLVDMEVPAQIIPQQADMVAAVVQVILVVSAVQVELVQLVVMEVQEAHHSKLIL
jgi:hypothetical protein